MSLNTSCAVFFAPSSISKTTSLKRQSRTLSCGRHLTRGRPGALNRQCENEMSLMNAMGVVVLAPYGGTLRQDSVATFKNDDKSIMYPELDEANDWQKTPNVVKLFYNTDQACIIAEAKNRTGSRVSLDARNQREQTYYEEVGELPDNKSKLTSLMDLAEDILRKKSCDIEYVTFEHAYIPVIPYQTITVEYANMTWTGTIDDTSVSLEPSTKAQTKLKRELYTDVIVTKSGQVLRGLDDETNA